MSLDVSKMLSKCKAYRNEEDNTSTMHWSSAKTLGIELKNRKKLHTSMNIFENAKFNWYPNQNYSFYAESEEKKQERPLYSMKYLGITNGKIGILTKKIPIPYKKSEQPAEPLELCIENKRIHHNFARPKKLIPVRIINKEKEPSKIINYKPEHKILYKKLKKNNLSHVHKPLKKFSSSVSLEKNEYFHEPYLKGILEKYTNK